MKETVKITMISERYRTDDGKPTCLGDIFKNEICQYYSAWRDACALLGINVDHEDDGQPIIVSGCPFWADDAEVL